MSIKELKEYKKDEYIFTEEYDSFTDDYESIVGKVIKYMPRLNQLEYKEQYFDGHKYTDGGRGRTSYIYPLETYKKQLKDRIKDYKEKLELAEQELKYFEETIEGQI